jgi:pantoate--beta-alanine ligase
MVADLNLAVRVESCPTVREPDGLAMSSRNALLSVAERRRARALPAALDAAKRLARAGERSAGALLEGARTAMEPFGVEPEYVALVDPATLEPVTELTGETLLALAARIGEVRLIDNAVLQPVTMAIPSRDTPTRDTPASAEQRHKHPGTPLPRKVIA